MGKNFLANNCKIEDRDDRGYYLVERWILSIIQTENPAKIIGEGTLKNGHFLEENIHFLGLTKIKNVDCTLQQISTNKICTDRVFGKYLKAWPLIKILDIGGAQVKTSFGTIEEPPIPPHIHAGIITFLCLS